MLLPNTNLLDIYNFTIKDNNNKEKRIFNKGGLEKGIYENLDGSAKFSLIDQTPEDYELRTAKELYNL